MAIATASIDFDRFDRVVKPAPGPGATELEALSGCPQLRGVPAANLEPLVRQASLRVVARGATIFPQGAKPDAALLVVRGTVRSVSRAANGREVSVELFREGELIADGALAPDAPLANDWEAAENATVLLVPREAFLSFLRTTPDVAIALGGQLVARLERSKRLATGLALAGVQDRVVARLIELGRQDGAQGPDGLLIRSRPTQQELANQIGACRETVSRTVSELVRQGLLVPRGKSLLIGKNLLESAG